MRGDTVIVNNIQVTGGTGDEGTLSWNAQEATMDLKSGGVTYQLGQEIAPLVRNSTGSTITNGTPVRFAGTNGNSGRLLVAPAIADGSIPSSYIVGVTTEDILNGSDGHVTWFGKVRSIDTSGTPYGQVWADGDIIYVSEATAGWLTNVKPEAPKLQITIAAVVNAHGSNGTLFVRPSWRSLLTDLDDVNGTPLTTTGQILVWDQSRGVFDFDYNITDYSPTIRNVTSTDTFSKPNETINCTSGTFTVNLPTSIGISGTIYRIKNSGVGVITLDAFSTETIDGNLTVTVNASEYYSTQSDGTNWIII